MNRTYNDWNPETRSLTDAGATLVRGDNGEDEFNFDGDMAKFLENLTACDESTLFVTVPGREKPLWISLVFGNSPGELVSDYVCHEILDGVSSSHYDKWENRKQPTKTGEYLDGKFVEDTTFQARKNALGING